MKHFFLLIIFSFKTIIILQAQSGFIITKKGLSQDTIIIGQNKIIVPEEWKAFVLGDINNDKVSDTAFVITPAYYASLDTSLASGYVFDSCVTKQCYNIIKFSSGLPDITFKNSLWGEVEALDDLDEDGIKEIIFVQNWHTGSHVNIYVLSFYKDKWVTLASNYLYYEDSYKNRVKKIDRKKFKFRIEYYNKSKHDIMNKEIIVNIKK